MTALEDTIKAEALGHNQIYLSHDFGSFFIQEQIEHLNDNLPRSMSKAKYTLMFRASKEIKIAEAARQKLQKMLRTQGRNQQADK